MERNILGSATLHVSFWLDLFPQIPHGMFFKLFTEVNWRIANAPSGTKIVCQWAKRWPRTSATTHKTNTEFATVCLAYFRFSWCLHRLSFSSVRLVFRSCFVFLLAQKLWKRIVIHQSKTHVKKTCLSLTRLSLNSWCLTETHELKNWFYLELLRIVIGSKSIAANLSQ